MPKQTDTTRPLLETASAGAVRETTGMQANDWLFGGDSPGVACSGDSGSGKTNTIEVILTALAKADQPFLYIDPTGNSARRLERVVADLPQRLRNKFLTIRPSDLSKIVSINPLRVDSEHCTPIEWQARITTKIAHVVRILLSAWGERDLHSKPRLFTWLYRILKTLAMCGLTIPDCRHFLDPRDPFFLSLVQAVPDPIARRAFEDLATRRPIEADEQIESARTRLLGFACESQVVEFTLGRSDDDVLNMRDVILDGRSVIISLELGGVLRDEDQAIFANLFLTDFLFEVMNMPAEQRSRYVIALDELPIFANNGSGPLLMRAIREVRQFLVRFLWGFQGKDAFDDERFFNLTLSQMGTLIAMRHTGLNDATAIGSHIALPSVSSTKEKLVLTQDAQYQDGHDLLTLIDESETWGSSEMEGSGEATSSTEQDTITDTTTTTDTTNRTVHPNQLSDLNAALARARAKALGSSRGRSTGTKHSSNVNRSTTFSRGGSRTRKQTLVPKLVTKEIITSVQYYTTEEQFMVQAAALAGLPTGSALVVLSGRGVYEVRFPLLTDPFAMSPKFAAKKLAELKALQRALPYYRAPDAILEQRQKLLEATIAELDRLAAQGNALRLIEPQDNEDTDDGLWFN